MLKSRSLVLVTVESCTGGALASAITDVPGASEVMRDGFVTYSNEAKIALGVPKEVITAFTVYSPQVAEHMALAGLKRSVGAQIGVGITGTLSREDPANPGSSVGEVFIGIASADWAPKWSRMEIPAGLPRPEAKRLIVQEAIRQLKAYLIG
jgi:nicotinamide-nucleotide amidase